MRTIDRDERGVSLVFIGICIVAIIAIVGIVVDGGRAYTNRRQVQNVADAAALAGTYQLDKYFNNDADASAILTAVLNSVTTNGANGTLVCNIVSLTQSGTTVTPNVLEACPTTTGTTLPAGAQGVQVSINDTQQTAFIKIVGVNHFTTGAKATGAVEALLGFDSPFLLCGLSTSQGGQDGYATLAAEEAGAPSASPPAPLLIFTNAAGTGNTLDANNWELNYHLPQHGTAQPAGTQDAANMFYDIHDQHVPTCAGGGSGFKGWSQLGQGSDSTPGWWTTQTGTRSGPARTTIAGDTGCTGSLNGANGCVLILPICVQSNGKTGSNYTLYCVTFGAFRIWDTSSGSSGNSHAGQFIGEGVVSEGQGGGIPAAGAARLISLVQ